MTLIVFMFFSVEPGIGRPVARPASPSALDADHLAERVHDLDEIGLRRHDGVDVLVGTRRLVDDAFVLAALDTLGRLGVVLDREARLGLAARHGATGAMRA